MRFSLRFLMMLIVLVALGANYWQLGFREKELQTEVVALQQRALERKSRLRNRDDQKQMYVRYFASHQQQVQQFSQAQAAFQAMADRRGKLRIDDPTKFAMVAVPSIAGEGELRQVRRIHVPQDAELQLMLDFVDVNRKPLDTPRIFSSIESQSWSLPTGESVVELQWSSKERRGSLRNGGETVLEFRSSEEEEHGSYSYGGVVVERQNSFTLGSPVEILHLSVGEPKECVRLRVGRSQVRAERTP